MALNSAKLRATIEAITDLPTLPTVVAKITSQIGNPSTNAADIGKLIEQDQALTSKVLRLVNSSYYGFPKQIKSIQHAVVIIGFNKVKTVVVTATVFDLLKSRAHYGLNLKRFWEHSLGIAISSKVVADLFGLGHSADDAFIGGLLHDIGKIILDQFLPTVYTPIVQYAENKGILLLEAEMEVMGVSHAQVGEWIMERWRLPPVIVNMVRQHHTLSRASDRREMVAAVHLGDILGRALGIGNGGDNRMPMIDSSVAASYMVDGKFLEKAIDKIYIEFGKADEFFALINE